MMAPFGTLEITSSAPIRLDGGTLSGQSVVTPAGVVIVRSPTLQSPLQDHRLGVLIGIFDPTDRERR